MLNCTRKSLVHLRASLRRKIEKNIQLPKFKLIFRFTWRFNYLFQFKDSMRRKPSLELSAPEKQ